PCDPRSLSHPSGVDGARFAPVLLRSWFVSCLPPRCWPLWWLWAACWLLGGGLVVGGCWSVLWGLCGVEGLGWWGVFLASGCAGVGCGVGVGSWVWGGGGCFWSGGVVVGEGCVVGCCW